MRTADIERVIGQKPGANGFQVTADNIANVRDWMVSQGISRDRANACRASTLERAYRYPQELRKLLWRGDYKGANECTASIASTGKAGVSSALTTQPAKLPNARPMGTDSTFPTTATSAERSGNDINGTTKPSAMGADPGAQQRQQPLAPATSQPDTTGEGIGGRSGETSLADTIEGIICGEFADDDVVRLFNACKAHLGE